VEAAGTLLGHGAVLGSVDNLGIVQPGGSIGLLSVAGNYVQRAAGALKIEVSQSLGVDADNARSLQPYAGIVVDKSLGDSAHPLTMQLSLDYAFELARRSRAVSVVSSDGTAFTALGVSLPRGRLVAGVRAAGALTKHTEFGVGYTGWLNTGRGSQHGADVTIRYRF
jgi:Autotransporter beta-domain